MRQTWQFAAWLAQRGLVADAFGFGVLPEDIRALCPLAGSEGPPGLWANYCLARKNWLESDQAKRMQRELGLGRAQRSSERKVSAEADDVVHGIPC